MNYFTQNAKDWDTPERLKRADILTAGILDALKPSKEMVGVDFGAGTGMVTIGVAKKVRHITALDSSEGMLGILRDKIKALQITNISTAAVDIESGASGFKDLDFIVSTMTMHHVQNISALTQVLYSMLKPGGTVVIVDLEPEDGTYHDNDLESVWHKGFDKTQLTRIFAAAGFKNITISTVYNMEKKTKDGIIRVYPIFLLSAVK